MKKILAFVALFIYSLTNAQENNAAQEKANKAAQEKESWLAKEKLKNITNATTLPSLPTSSVIGLQIKKSGVINRKLNNDFCDIYYMNGKFVGGDVKQGLSYDIQLSSEGFEYNYPTKTTNTERVFKTSSNELIIQSGYSSYYTKEINDKSIKFECNVDLGGKLLDIAELKDGKTALLSGKVTYYYKTINDLCLTIWDHKNNKSVKFLVQLGIMSPNPQLVATKDNNLIIGFDTRKTDEDLDNRTTFEKVNVAASFTGNELKSLWKKTYSIADAYMLTDMIEDTKGNIVCMMKSNVRTLKSTFAPEKGLECVEYGMVKFNSKGGDFRNEVVKKLSKDKWGRSSEGGSLTMDNQEEIYFSAYENPRIIQNPNGNGYIICGRYIYGLWAYSTNAESVSTSDGRTRMFADQPAFFFADENSLDITSTDFIETTYSKDKGHYYREFKPTNQLGMNWSIRSFQYIPELKQFLLLESKSQKPFESHLWLFDIKLKNNWKGEASANTETASNAVTKSNSGDQGKTKKSVTVESKSCFVLNDLTQEQMGGKNSIKLGFTSFKLATTYIAKGKTLEVDCDDVIVYRLKNENTSEYDSSYDLFRTKGKCGQTIKLSDYWK